MKIDDLEKFANRLLKIPSVSILPRMGQKRFDDGTEYATFTARLLAMTIDLLLIYAFLGAGFVMVSEAIFPHLSQQNVHSTLSQAVNAYGQTNITFFQLLGIVADAGMFHKLAFDYLLQSFVSGALIVFFWNRYGRSPGMIPFRMYIIDKDTREKPTLKQFIIRYLVGIVAAAPFLLGFFWLIFDKHNQAWHDKAANTLVLRRPFIFWKKKKPTEKDEAVESAEDTAEPTSDETEVDEVTPKKTDD